MDETRWTRTLLLRADLADATFVAAVNTGNSFAPRIAAHRESRGATAGPSTAHRGPSKQASSSGAHQFAKTRLLIAPFHRHPGWTR
jgi:hypothetical protein